jgi:hypothetical protein
MGMDDCEGCPCFFSSMMYLHLHVFNWITSIYFIDYDKRIN